MTDMELRDYHKRVTGLWHGIKEGDKEAAFAVDLAWAMFAGMHGQYSDEYAEVGWKDFTEMIQAVSQKYGDRSPEDYVCGGLVEGVRRAIERGKK